MRKPTTTVTGLGGFGFWVLVWLAGEANLNVPVWLMVVLGIPAAVMATVAVVAWVKTGTAWFRQYRLCVPFERRDEHRTQIDRAERLQTFFQRREISIRDLLEHDGAVSDRTFEDCYIDGPAVVYPYQCQFNKPVFVTNVIESLLWELSPNQEAVIGAIELRRCVFRRCRFNRIGIVGPPDFIASLRDYLLQEARGGHSADEGEPDLV